MNRSPKLGNKTKIPNAGSFSARLGKSLRTNKTRMLQKMGKEGTDYAPEYKSNNAKCKEMVVNYTDLIKLSKMITKESQTFFISSVSLAELLIELSTTEKFQGLLGPSLLKLAESNKLIESRRFDLFTSSLSSNYIIPIERFKQIDLMATRKAKQAFREALIQFDASANQIMTPISKCDKPLELFLAYTQYHYDKKKSNKRYIESSNKLEDVIEHQEFEVLEYFVKYFRSQNETQEFVYKVLQDIIPISNELTKYIANYAQTYATAKQQEEEQIRINNQKEIDNKYKRLVECLANPNLAVVNAICTSAGADQDVILESLVRIFDSYKLTLPIIKLGITNEVANTNSAATLFRGNSTPTKLMSQFTKATGKPYLQNTIKPLILEILSSPSGYEVNPLKVVAGENIEENMNTLMRACQQIMDVILGSASMCPPPFKAMASHLRLECSSRFPDYRDKSVGGFIFLRFFCPAILTPESNGFMGDTVKISVEQRRPLILISKVIQNLANGIMFGKKEEYMLPVNSFIEKNTVAIKTFFDEIADVPADVMNYMPLASMEDVDANECPKVHRYIVDNLQKIAKSLSSYEEERANEIMCSLIKLVAKLDEDG